MDYKIAALPRIANFNAYLDYKINPDNYEAAEHKMNRSNLMQYNVINYALRQNFPNVKVLCEQEGENLFPDDNWFTILNLEELTSSHVVIRCLFESFDSAFKEIGFIEYVFRTKKYYRLQYEFDENGVDTTSERIGNIEIISSNIKELKEYMQFCWNIIKYQKKMKRYLDEHGPTKSKIIKKEYDGFFKHS